MSARLDVYSAVVNALAGTTSEISYVTRNLEQWWDWNVDKFPGVRVIDTAEEKTPLSYLMGTTSVADMEGVITFKVSGYVQDLTNQNLSAQRSALMNAIERIILTDSTLSGKVADIWPITGETDEGVIDNYAWCDLTFKARYFYNHAST